MGDVGAALRTAPAGRFDRGIGVSDAARLGADAACLPEQYRTNPSSEGDFSYTSFGLAQRKFDSHSFEPRCT